MQEKTKRNIKLYCLKKGYKVTTTPKELKEITKEPPTEQPVSYRDLNHNYKKYFPNEKKKISLVRIQQLLRSVEKKYLPKKEKDENEKSN